MDFLAGNAPDAAGIVTTRCVESAFEGHRREIRGRVAKGALFVAVHCDEAAQAMAITNILSESGAEDIFICDKESSFNQDAPLVAQA